MFGCSWTELQGGAPDLVLVAPLHRGGHPATLGPKATQPGSRAFCAPAWLCPDQAHPKVCTSQNPSFPLLSWQGDRLLCPLLALKVLGNVNDGSLCVPLWPSLAPTGKWEAQGASSLLQAYTCSNASPAKRALTESVFTHQHLMTS